MSTAVSAVESQVAPYVRLLGEPSITLASGRLSFLRDRRYLLLAYLAYHGDWVPRERLARLFWPAHERGDARLNVRQLLRRTRQLWWRPDIEASEHRQERWLRWSPRTDLAELERAVADHDHDAAIALFGGALLAGLTSGSEPEFTSWVETERLRVHDRWRDTLLAHAQRLVSEGSHRRAARMLAFVLRQDGFDEDVLRAYLTAETLAGRARRALAAYDAFTHLLAAETGLAPTALTQALVQQIRDGRLADDHELTRVGVSSVVTDGATRVTLSTPGPSRPAPAPPLVGRDRELTDVARSLSDPACRLVTVTGPGGVGKTCFARRAASELHLNYREGAAYVALESVPVGGSIPDAIAAALRVSPSGDIDLSPLERVARAIGDMSLLIVLDNVEHLGSSGEVVSALLARCPNLKLLTTSRGRLDLAEEWLFPLEGLAYPEQDVDLSEGRGYDAVRLFEQRARRVRPGYRLTAGDLPYVIDICRLVDGLPLGIELAAAWLRSLPPQAVAEEIERDSDFLDRSQLGVPDRHRSIRATFEYSWRRLEPAAQAALRDLAVFHGAFDAQAAVHVTLAKLAVIATLVDRSLLTARGDGRFSLHPLLRQYAGEKLATEHGSENLARGRHARHQLRRLTSSSDLSGATHLAALAALDSSFADLAAGWRWAHHERLFDELGRAAAPLATLCWHRARYKEGHDLLGLALSAPVAAEAGSLAQVRLLVQHARLSERLGRHAEARHSANQALELLPGAQGSPEHLTALQVLGTLELHEGRYEEARRIFSRALGFAYSHAARAQIARFSANVGLTEQYLGHRRRAAVWYRRALRLQRELDDPTGTVSSLSNLGNVLRLLGCLEKARRLLGEALDLAERIAANDVLPNLYVNLGVLELTQGQHAAAEARFDAALQLARKHGKRNLEVNALFQLGRCCLVSGDANTSQERFLETLRLATEIGYREKVIDGLVGLAWVRARLGDVDRAVHLLSIALEHGEASPGTTKWAAELREVLALGAEPSPVGTQAAAGGTVVMRAVQEALARSR